MRATGSTGSTGSTGQSDVEALRSLAADDPSAFESLFERYSDLIYNFVFRRTVDWSVAEDVTESVFLQLWRQRRVLVAQGGSLRPWLIAVASNHVKRGWRGQERQRRALARLVPIDGGAGGDHADDVAARVDDERRMRELHAVLDDLPDAHREVLTLWAWEQLSYEEISVVLGVPVGTVRSRLSRARARLDAVTGTGRGVRGSMTGSSIPTTDGMPCDGTRGGHR